MLMIDECLIKRCLKFDPTFNVKQTKERIKAIPAISGDGTVSMFLDDRHYLMTVNWNLI